MALGDEIEYTPLPVMSYGDGTDLLLCFPLWLNRKLDITTACFIMSQV